MATYLKGVGSYIPALQPYQPNLSLLANVLEKKQSQYDTNFKAINDIYGKYFYADLTREDNLKRKDAMLKQIDLELKRVAGLDLSLSQNADQALQVFKPFYEDSYLMKDMATTKNYKSRRGTAEALKTSTNKEKKSQYWNTGVKAMDYQMEEFKNMPLQETLGFQDPVYTPYKNPTEYFSKLAKDADLSIDITQPSPDGMYFVRKKNGELLIDPLTTLFSSAVSNDPQLQEVYSTLAYVERKDNMYANKDKYGSLEESERAYLTDEYRKLQEFSKKYSERSQEHLNEKKVLKEQVESSYQDGNYSERTDAAAKELDESIARNEAVANQAKNLDETLASGESSSAVTSNGITEDLNDIQSLRAKVDYAKSIDLMSKDINASVHALMNKDRVEDIEVNPVGLENLRHGHRLGEMAQKHKYDLAKMQYKAQLDWDAYSTKELVKNGVLQVKADKTIDYSDAYKQTLTKRLGQGTFETNTEGTVRKSNESYIDEQSNKNKGIVEKMINFYAAQLDKQKGKGGKVTDNFGKLFGSYGQKKGIDGLRKEMEKNPEGLMRKIDLNKAMSAFTNQTTMGPFKGIPDAESIVMDPRMGDLRSYVDLLETYANSEKKNTEIARRGIARDIDINKAGDVDEWFTNLMASDVDINFDKKTMRELNQRMASYMINNVSAGIVSKKIFYGNLLADKKPLSNGKTPMEMVATIEKERYKHYTGLNPYLIPDPKRGYNAIPSTGSKPGHARLTTVLYDKYKANWETRRDNLGYKSVYTGNWIQGAKGMVFNRKADFATGKTILPKAWGTPNRNLWTEFMTDLNSINWSDNTNKISLNGLGANAKNEKNVGLTIISAIQSQISKGEGPNFEMYQSQIASNNGEKGAMIIFPTVKQLQDLGLVGGSEKDKKLLSQAKAATIAAQGISVIADRGYFNNWLFQDALLTPAEARVNLRGADGIHYKDPFGAGYYHVTPLYSGSDITGYNITGKFKQLDPQTGKAEDGQIFRSDIALGGQLDETMQGLEDQLALLNKQNDKVYRQFNPKK